MAVKMIASSVVGVIRKVIPNPAVRRVGGSLIRHKIASSLFGAKSKDAQQEGPNALISVHGVEHFKKRLFRLQKNDKKALIRGMQKSGNRLIQESKLIVPLDTGKLRDSTFERLVKHDKKQIIFEVGYRSDYALLQHENLFFRHLPGRSAKYLEKPVRQNRRTLIKIVEDEVRKAGA